MDTARSRAIREGLEKAASLQNIGKAARQEGGAAKELAAVMAREKKPATVNPATVVAEGRLAAEHLEYLKNQKTALVDEELGDLPKEGDVNNTRKRAGGRN